MAERDDEFDWPAVRDALLRWYRRHRRDLPWRKAKPNPYHVLVSEAMLQQTQVATVVSYFERFIEAFPDVRALASADESRVLRLWQGLGYYRRARNLHAAARAIVERHGGEVPSDVERLRELPGVGEYTAGAIASIAFSRRAAIVDGNVARVLSRWHALREPIDTPAMRKELWRLAGAAVPGEAPGDFNQAMMELGAMVCSPRGPACLTCPVREHCKACIAGQTQAIPARLERRKPREVTHHIVAIRRRGAWLFLRRPADGLWSNMWGFPTAESLAATRESDVAGWVRETTGLSVRGLARVDAFTHQTTHRTIRFTLWSCDVDGGRLRGGLVARWRRPGDVDDLALANPQRRAVAAVAR